MQKLDISLAVGPDHIFQILNGNMAVFSKKGKKYPATGKLLYGAVPNNTVFAGFGPGRYPQYFHGPGFL